MAVTYHCAECGRRAQVNVTPDGPSLCLVCADLADLAGLPDTSGGMGAEDDVMPRELLDCGHYVWEHPDGRAPRACREMMAVGKRMAPCRGCGATIIQDSGSGRCAYCGHPTEARERRILEEATIDPDALLPDPDVVEQEGRPEPGEVETEGWT